MIIEFSKAVSLLLALCLIYGFIARQWANNELFGKILSGLLFGGICVIGMMTPIEITPGVIFDARSVVLSMSGLFGGPVVGGIAAVIAGGYRAWLGGGGAPVGISVVISCTLLGLAYRYFRQRGWLQIGVLQLLAFGLLVHLVEVALFSLLPDDVVESVMETIALPLILTFTPATALLGTLLRAIESQIQTGKLLAESKVRFKDFAEGASDWFWEMDAGLRYTYFSPGYEQHSGVPTQDAVGRTRAELYADVLPKLTSKEIEQWEGFNCLVEAGESFHDRETKWVNPNGRIEYFVTSGTPIFDAGGEFAGYWGVGSNITERKQAEEKLRENERRLQAATKVAKLGYYIWDLVADRCVYCSEEYARIHGMSVEEYMASTTTLESDSQWVHPEDRPRFLAAMNASLESNETFELEYRILGKDGQVRYVREKESFNEVKDGVDVTTEGTLQDITEIKQAEEQLLQAQKMEAIGRLTGGVAHDFNNLLAVIQGNLELIGEQVRGSDLEEMIRDALLSAERGARLTGQLLAFGRQAHLTPMVIDVNGSLRAMGDMIHLTIPAVINLEMSFGDDLWPATLDKDQLAAAVLNLVINARDAMPEGGKLTIETANAALADEDLIRFTDGLSPGRYVTIGISDTGQGMDAETVAKAFDPFFTTKPVGQGTGLGLSMVHGYARQSGGDVVIESTPGQGTTVRLYFPACEREPSSEMSLQEPGLLRSARGETILVAEDQADVRRVVVAQLESFGYNVLEANDGDSALLVLNEEREIDLLLTDMVMPGSLQGPALAKQASSLRPGIRVIFMTGYPKGIEGGDMEIGPGDVKLTKPISRIELASSIWKQLNDGRPE